MKFVIKIHGLQRVNVKIKKKSTLTIMRYVDHHLVVKWYWCNISCGVMVRFWVLFTPMVFQVIFLEKRGSGK